MSVSSPREQKSTIEAKKKDSTTAKEANIVSSKSASPPDAQVRYTTTCTFDAQAGQECDEGYRTTREVMKHDEGSSDGGTVRECGTINTAMVDESPAGKGKHDDSRSSPRVCCTISTPGLLVPSSTEGDDMGGVSTTDCGTALGSSDVPGEKKLSYATKEFWDQRFIANPQTFDWYATWEELKPFFQQHAPAPKTVLMVGCGNSTLSADMVADGYMVTNIDISEVVINFMRDKHPNMEWYQMDATEMTFEDNTFDIVIDKGTIDALACDPGDEDDGDADDEEEEAIYQNYPRVMDKLVGECCRVCNIGGLISLVSHSKARDRLVVDAIGEEKCATELATICPLSKESVMIKILRNAVGRNSGIKEAMTDPVIWRQALIEYRDYMKDQVVVKKIMEHKAKNGPRLDSSWKSVQDSDALATRTQLHCHIYFIRMQ